MMSKRLSKSHLFFTGILAVFFALATATSSMAKDRNFHTDEDCFCSKKAINSHIGDECFCSKTSKAALKACRHEIKDDFWIAIGNCNNLSDPDEREECLSEAGIELKEAQEECKDQYRSFHGSS